MFYDRELGSFMCFYDRELGAFMCFYSRELGAFMCFMTVTRHIAYIRNRTLLYRMPLGDDR